MFNSTELLINAFVYQLQNGYHHTYGGYKADYAEIIAWAGSMALENIANSDALYHNIEHTILVSLVGQEILRGKHIREGGISCEDWLHFIISLLCHDIGYVKGVCRGDRPEEGLYATGKDDVTVTLPLGATAASLAAYRVDRGKLFVDERFGGHRLIDAQLIKRNIELTRFPVVESQEYQEAINLGSLVRAADLIGELSDPRYLQKVSAMYYELEEAGFTQSLGYTHPGDLRSQCSTFYWSQIHPYVQQALYYLELTQEGKQIIATLYANVFRSEHQISDMEVA